MAHRSTAPVSGQEFHPFQFRGTFLPAHVHGLTSRGKLTGTEQSVFSLIDALSDGERGCYATNNYMAAALGVERKTVIRAVAKLARLDLISVQVADRNRRTIRINPRVFTAAAGPQGGSTTGGTPGVPPVVLHKKRKKKKQSTAPNPKPARVGRTCPTPDASGPLPRAEEESSVLIDMGTPATTKATPTDSDYAAADRLRQIVTQDSRYHDQYRRSSWAAIISRVRRKAGGDAARIERALDYLAKHRKEPWCPLVQAATSFEAKFPQIEAGLARLERDQPTTELSPAAQALVKQLTHELAWKGSEARLGAAVQRSFDRFLTFHEQLTEKARGTGRTARLAQKLLAGPFGSTKRAMKDWFERVNARILCWKDWSGKFDWFVWSPTHQWVEKDGRDTAEERSGHSRDWDELLKELGYGG